MHIAALGFKRSKIQAFLLSCYHQSAPIQRNMKFILLISNAFINTMGITQPSPQAAKRAAWFIVALLALVASTILTIAVLAIHWASHQ